MSILIKGIEMPTGCGAVTLKLWDDGQVEVFDQDGDWKVVTAIPVPEPHGRLGDLDTLAESVTTPGIFPPVVSSEVFAFLRNAPTIIPENEGEKK